VCLGQRTVTRGIRKAKGRDCSWCEERRVVNAQDMPSVKVSHGGISRLPATWKGHTTRSQEGFQVAAKRTSKRMSGLS